MVIETGQEPVNTAVKYQTDPQHDGKSLRQIHCCNVVQWGPAVNFLIHVALASTGLVSFGNGDLP